MTAEERAREVLEHEPWCWTNRHGLCDCGAVYLARAFPDRYELASAIRALAGEG